MVKKRIILFLAASPKDTPPVGLAKEVNAIQEELQKSEHRNKFDLQQNLAVQVSDIRPQMLKIKPQIVHFSGHGAGDEGLIFFDDKTNQSKTVDAQALAGLFKLFQSVECVVLNGCYSKIQAEAIAQHVNYVIGMEYAISDEAAIKFARGFYSALGSGESFEAAFEHGRSEIQMADLGEHLTPRLINKRGIDETTETSQPSPTQSMARPSLTAKAAREPISKRLEDYGLIEITNDFLDEEAKKITDDLIARFFDVYEPGWPEAMDEKIPRRDMVNKLVGFLNRSKSGLRVTLLLGPGCEGKSTVLRQTVCCLVKTKTSSNFRIIWWEADDPKNLEHFTMLLSQLPKLNIKEKWLIVFDDPSTQLIKIIYDLCCESLGCRDIEFLLCCRDTVWKTYGEKLGSGRQNCWENRLEAPQEMGELTDEEAKKILEAWKAAGKLEYQDEDEANLIHKLLEEQKSDTERFYLAAMLRICENKTVEEGVQWRLKKILTDIKKKPKYQFILDAYACIVAMHKEGLSYLKPYVLAKAINYKPTQLRSDILEELGNEIILPKKDKQAILTRQRSIAEVVYELMSRSPHSIDFEDKIYPRLATSAQKLLGTVIDRHSTEIRNWQYKFPEHFAEEEPKRIDLAIRIAENLYHENKEEHLFTKLAQLYRDNGRSEKSVDLCRNCTLERRDRKFYHTWAYAEYETKNYVNSVCLCEFALADSTRHELDGESIMIYLSTVGLAFDGLCRNSGDDYAQALGASAQLGLKIAPGVKFDKDPEDKRKKTTIENLNNNIKRARDNGVAVTKLEQKDLKTLFENLQTGFKKVNPSFFEGIDQNLIKQLNELKKQLNELTFEKLKEKLGIPK
ncbi:CHAT domain-containing protein [Nostoc sp. CHAB 5844]|nr:CHAT domain-containing protein [Nostoc sp. CHAB 5844]